LLKIIAAILGYLSLGFWGAILGWFIGGTLDRYRAYGAGAVNPLTSKRRQTVFLETLFGLMGKLAKADGHISQQEIDQAEQFMSQLGMTGDHRRQAIHLFQTGSTAQFDIEPLLRDFLQACGHTHNLKQMLLVYLAGFALADGSLDAAEEQLLRQIAIAIGFNEAAFQQLLHMLRGQDHFASGQAPSASALQAAYDALGVTEDQTDQHIKKAYRRLMSQFHPDKLIGQGMPEDMVKMATERSKEIQAAYELIKKS